MGPRTEASQGTASADAKPEPAKESEKMIEYSKYVAKHTKGLIKSNFTAKRAKSTMKSKPPTEVIAPQERTK